MSASRRTLLLGAAAMVLSGCAVSPLGGSLVPPTPEEYPESGGGVGTAPSSAPPSSASPSPTPTPAPTTPAGGLIVPGTNHGAAATPYTYRSADVHRWLTGGPTAAGYPAGKVAFLTFDDGPNDTMTPRVLDALKQLKVPATFFYIAGPNGLGKANPAIVRRALAEGHAIAVHSYSHNYSYLYPKRVGNTANITADLDKALAAIRGVVGPEYVSHAFRYPGGHMSWRGLDAADQALAARDMWWLDWNCMSGDAEKVPPTSKDAMVAMLSNTLRLSGNPGVAVMLNHDSAGAALTLASLPAMVGLLREKGYSFGVLD